MAQTNRKRRRRHRGTQAGTIEARGRTSRPQAGSARKPAAPKTAQQRRAQRLAKPPTWRGAFNRALLAAVLFAVFIALTTKNVARGVVLGVLVLLFYIPLTYYMDRWMYRRRQRKESGT